VNLSRRRNEAWMIDMALGTSGTEAMWPGMVPAWLECGQRQIDLERTMARVRSFKMITKEWEKTARKLEAQALVAERAGNTITAAEFYQRAAICYGRSKWPIMDSSSVRKRELHEAEDRCFDKVIAYNDLYTLERVEIPFEGSSIAGILHLPKDVKSPPCVVFVPGMDMTKEDFPNVQNNVFVRRGMACLSIDGPGQGASNLRGIQSRLGTYEKALAAVLDALERRDDLDGANVSLLGLSLGGYYSVRGAAANPKFRAHVSMIGLYGHLDQFFMAAPPNFRHFFMYMAGIRNDAELDAQVDELSAPRLAPQIKVPTLIVTAEYDQLTPLEAAEAFFDNMKCPKEIWIAEGQFHPVGALRANLWPMIADWIKNVASTGLPTDHNVKTIIPES
jgi:alpha-beta hydrolase superfamily lysophospholipase